MAAPAAQYISASRRTDLPRFFHDSFFRAWQQGAITYDGGYGRSYTVSLQNADVLGYIFWSKDFGPFLADPRFPELLAANNTLFHFTLNHCQELEPGLAPVEKRLATMASLCDRVGPSRVLWRFDPLCRYSTEPRVYRENHRAFFELLPIIAGFGVRRCYFSFMTAYHKLKNRGVSFAAFSSEEQKSICLEMAAAAEAHGVTLYNCSSDLPARISSIRQAACIDDALLAATDRFSRHQPLPAKPTRQDCGCFFSRDIGSYRPPCPHGCLYCYANPVNDHRAPNLQRYRPAHVH